MRATSKILTVVVPVFNGQDCLGRCLDSLLIPDQALFRALEVLVVNDGSTDGTSALARGYAERHPGVFRVIDKENGNSGSCINAALAVAAGKYFRELDADDWFDTAALAELIRLLEERNEDIVSTLKKNHFPDGMVVSYEGLGVDYGKTCLIDGFRFVKGCDKVHFTMHAMSYRTDFLRSIGYRQQEGLYYTDQDLCYFPLKAARDIWFSELCVYQYSEGNPDQSVARRNVILHRHDIFLIVRRQLEDFLPIQDALGECRRRLLLEVIVNSVLAFRSVSPASDPDWQELVRLISRQPELAARFLDK